MNEIIEIFLAQQKNAWLKKEINPSISENKKGMLIETSNRMFSKTVLKDAIVNLTNSKNIERLNFASHIPKFSNPCIKLTGFIFDTNKRKDGFLRSGNVNRAGLDIFSNSGAGDHTKELIYVYEFLTFYANDGKMILEYLQQKDKTQARELFAKLNLEKEFDGICTQLLSMVNQIKPTKTHESVKQVYFPVGDDYHLLSILYPSPIMSKLRQRIDEMKFGDNAKQAKEDKKNDNYNLPAISDIYNLTKIGFGGANKQNISVLNNKNGGDFYLLPSVPPPLRNRSIQPPKIDFFVNCLWVNLFKDDFKDFHQVLVGRKNNKPVRVKRDSIVLNSITKVQRLIGSIRDAGVGWSKSDIYDKLDDWQKIWLDDENQDIRKDDKQNKNYLQQAQSGFANWFIGNYQISTNDNKTLGTNDVNRIKDILSQEKELLK